MSLIDVAIPGVIGLVLLLWPQAMFLGSRVGPTEKKIRMLRYSGALLLLVAAVYLVIKFVSR
jgi:phosphate starvation-inducible membrane PsiE